MHSRGSGRCHSYKDQDVLPAPGVVDLERGRMAKASRSPWKPSDSITGTHGATWKTTATDQRNICSTDCGYRQQERCLLLNVPRRPMAKFPATVERTFCCKSGGVVKAQRRGHLRHRPWTVFGEGPTKVVGGHLARTRSAILRPKIFVSPRRATCFNAIVLGWPGKQLLNKSLRQGHHVATAKLPVSSCWVLLPS